jgi:hypothetical protein
MDSRVRVCSCCGEPFEVWSKADSDKDKCGQCEGKRMLSLALRATACREQFKRDRERRHPADED